MNHILEHNRIAWNKEVQKGNVWTIPVKKDELDAAEKGDVKIVLTPYKPVPKHWLGNVKGKNVLCLASGGGQLLSTIQKCTTFWYTIIPLLTVA